MAKIKGFTGGKNVKVTTELTVPQLDYYSKLLANAAGATIDNLIFGQLVGYRKKKVTKYLSIPIPYFEWHHDYDEDGMDYGLEGLLIGLKWKETFIPIGKKIIEVPSYRKTKNRTIRFVRYKPTKTGKKINKIVKKALKKKKIDTKSKK